MKKVLILVGIIIIVVVAIIIFGGVFAWQYFSTKPQPKVAQTQVQTANWKTYTNTKYGFSIKYPLYFSTEESGRPDEVVLFTNNDKSINIFKIQFGLALGMSGPIPFEQYVQDAQIVTNFSKGGVVRFLNKSSDSITYEVVGAPTHIPSVETVIKYVNGNTNEAITLDINGQNAIDIKKLENKDYSDFADLEKINSEMVSTFKFTNTVATCIPEGGNYGAPKTSANLCCAGLVEQPTTQSGTVGICVKPTDQTAGWQTYTGAQYGFHVSYPTDIAIEKPMAGGGINLKYKNGTIEICKDDGTSACGNFPGVTAADAQKITRDITINGQKYTMGGLVLNASGEESLILGLQNNMYIYLDISGPQNTDSANTETKLLQVISTFKFTK